jgi:hypothetical protein
MLFGTDVISIKNNEDGVLLNLRDIESEKEF